MAAGEWENARSAMRSGHEREPETLEFITALIRLATQPSEVNYYKKLATMASSSPGLALLFDDLEALLASPSEQSLFEVCCAAQEKFDQKDYLAAENIISRADEYKNEPTAQRIRANAQLNAGMFEDAVGTYIQLLESEPSAYADQIRLGDALAA